MGPAEALPAGLQQAPLLAFASSVRSQADAISAQFPEERDRLTEELRELAGSDGTLAYPQFCKALGLQDSSFPRQLFATCDAQNGGGGATPACVAGLSLLLSKGSSEDTLHMVFNAYLAQEGQPVDGTGNLGAAGLQCALEELLLVAGEKPPEGVLQQLVADLIALGDQDGDGGVSFEEFFQLAMRYRSFRELAGLQQFGSSVYSRRAMQQSFGSRASEAASHMWWTIVGAFPSYSFWLLFAAVAVIPLYFYLRPSKIYSTGAAEVWIAKFCGVTAAGCSVFLLPPVTKTLTDNLRRIPGMTRVFNFDANISVHKLLGIIILVTGTVHSISWWIAFATVAGSNDWEEISVKAGPSCQHLDPSLSCLFGQEVAITGYILLCALFLALPFATRYPKAWLNRNTRLAKLLNDYRWFWGSHMTLFIVYYTCLILHPLPGDPSVAHKGKVYLYVCLPLAIYLAGAIWNRLRRRGALARVVKGEIHDGPSSKVVVLHMQRPVVYHYRHPLINLVRGLVTSRKQMRFFEKAPLNYSAGQYVRVMCPNISTLEWHPFTISSAPGEEHMTLHIAAVGDWTRSLYQLVKNGQDEEGRVTGLSIPWWMTDQRWREVMDDAAAAEGDAEKADRLTDPSKLPTIFMEGPFGAPALHHARYDTLVLAATGVGVTPMVSILKQEALAHLESQKDSPKGEARLQRRIYFFWVVREKQALGWVQDALEDVQAAVWGRGEDAAVDITIYYTGGRNKPDRMVHLLLTLANEVHQETAQRDLLLGAPPGVKSSFGRPDWNSILRQVQRENRGSQEIGVLFCGAKPAEVELKRACTKLSKAGSQRFMAARPLPALLASEVQEQAVFQAYQRDAGELTRAFKQYNTATLCVLGKALPYKALAAAASLALGAEDDSIHSSTALQRLSRVLSWWPPAAATRWGEAAARDQRRWLRTQDQSLLVAVAGSPPREPGRHWSNVAVLPSIRMRTCYMCRQAFVKGHSLGQWGPADGGHSHVCFHCGLANLRELQAQEGVSLAGMHAVVTGCRHTVGFAVTLRLLRCGARVLGTSRFPGAALLNFAQEPDFEAWRGRLELMACDLLQPAQVDALVRRIAAGPPHIYVSNAFLTVEQSSAYYAAVRGIEARMAPPAPAQKPRLKLPRLLSRLLAAQAAMQRAQRQAGGGGQAFGLAGGSEGQGGRRHMCFLINVTSTEHLHQAPAHAVTSMSKAAMETLWEKVALERCPGVAAYSADQGFVSGVNSPGRKPLTAADGAARVLYPTLAWASSRLPDRELANVLVWKDFLPFRVLPAARELLRALRMHPLGPVMHSGAGKPAAVRGSTAAGAAGQMGELEVVQVLDGFKVSMVVGGTLRDLGPFCQADAQMAYNFIASVVSDAPSSPGTAGRRGRRAGANRRIHAQFNKLNTCLQALRSRGIVCSSASALLAGAAISRQLEVAQMVLARVPAAAAEAGRFRGGWGLAHYAARYKSEGVLRLLQQTMQGLEDGSDVWGRLPIHYAARRNHAPTVRLLAQAAPYTALVADGFGHCTLSVALYRGYAAATDAMLEALPAAPLLASQAVAGLTRAGGFKASHYGRLVRSLLPVVPADCMLLALQRSLAAHEPAAGLLAEALLHHLPLTEQQWALVPARTPGLGRAVDAVLTQQAQQAEQLAARLEEGDALRLRRALGALCLQRSQRQLDVELSPQVATQILRLVE
ncbi:respiratory burst oxidase-like protein B [Chlorella sorokiniana]|uniref:Respiratory burst oxidase-like protein B n=1 Tax=Chlorella sorokiniana TaxID=3076 RepID=A0A2P6U2P5_CHLSO|nr:respiratory burst oxidase-like protein B [Chlorella sorokiniana]|eukprot:PRW60582.1 respiratory burst oxidase-like protein B [Chlorella sorokiniana]